MTDTFSEGDLVEATKGETVLRGRVEKFVLELGVNFGYLGCYHLTDLENRAGFTLKTIEKAAPALPTESGTVLWVEDRSGGRHWVVRTTDGWVRLHWGEVLAESEIARVLDVVAVPASVTARKVLDRVREGCFLGPNAVTHYETVAKEFGVTS